MFIEVKQKELELLNLRKQYYTQAQLTEMCDECEIKYRTRFNLISEYEMTKTKVDTKKIIKSFQRNFDNNPSLIRTVDTLYKCTIYLLDLFVNDNGEFVKLYNFISDRLKQIRLELSYLNYIDEELYIKIIRFYVYSHSQLKNNKENLKELQLLLSYLQNVETIRYQLVIACFQNNIQCVDLLNNVLTKSMFSNKDIDELIQLNVQIKSGNIFKFFIFYSTVKNQLIKSILHGFVNQVRLNIFQIIQKTFIQIDKSVLEKILQLEDNDKLTQFLQNFGIDLENETEKNNGFKMSSIRIKPQIDLPFQPLQLDKAIILQLE